jgi:hypothetical protein
MKRLLSIAAGALIFAIGIQAAKADPANPPEASAASSAAAFPPDVLPTAKWWIHIDFDTARETEVGKHLHEKVMKEPHAKEFLEKINDKWGLDLHKDLHAATLYSPSYIPHTGVLIAYAEASDGEKFMAELRKKPDFLELKTAGDKYTLYTWTEMGPHLPMGPMKKPVAAEKSPAPKPVPEGPKEDFHAHMMHQFNEFMLHPHPRSAWACFPQHGVAIFADSATNLVAALNHTENLSGSATPAADGTVFSGELCDIDTLPLPPQMRLAKKIASIRFNSGEKDGKDFDHVEVNLTDAAVAGQLKAIIAGLQAMGQVHFADHADLLKMIDALKVDASGQTVTIDWQAPSDDVIHFMDKVCDFIHKHHAEWHK